MNDINRQPDDTNTTIPELLRMEETQRPERERRFSPFVINLKPPLIEVHPTPQPKKTKLIQTKRRLPNKWQMMLDERIYLKEMRHRSVSIRPRGWRDLPPKEALTLIHAVTITIRNFFEGHPMAELTVLALLQTVMVLIYRLTLQPLISLLPTPVKNPTIKISPVAVTKPIKPTTKLKLPTLPVVHLPKPNLDKLLPAKLTTPRLRLAPVWALASLALAVLLPLGIYKSFGSLNLIKADTMDQGLQAMESLKLAQTAAQTSDFNGVQAAFRQAEEHFTQIKNRLGILSSVLTAAGSIVPSSNISTAGLMLVVGDQLTAGGKKLASGLDVLESNVSPSEKLRGLEIQLSRAMPHLMRANDAVALMSPESLPVEYRDTLGQAKSELPRIVGGMDQLTHMAGFLALLVGSEQPRRYLVVFQNDSELRPTGGFIGSFALLDVNQGKVTNLEIPGGGSYDLQGSLTEKLVSPRPLRLINPHWQFQDANWSPDFPTSAQRLAWFYEKSGGPTVDGVIAINANVMERLLAVVGPIEMPKYEVALSSENFMTETQREVELDYNREENQPKQIISDLAPIILDLVMNAERDDYLPLAEAVSNSLADREIQMWFNDPDMQNRSVELGWSGEIRTSPGDYLQLVHSNIAGQKTDSVMTEQIRHDAKVLADGSALVTLTVTRTHNGIKGETFTGVRNVDYLRVYVPLGSTLVEANGFESPDPKLFKLPDPDYVQDPTLARIQDKELLDRRSGTRTTTENGKTVFGNWVQTDPGQTSEISLTYQLPPGTVELQGPQGSLISSLYTKLTNSSESRRLNYSLLIQKQSGAVPAELISTVDLPRGYSTIWSSPDHETDERGREVASATLTHDLFFGVMGEMPIR